MNGQWKVAIAAIVALSGWIGGRFMAAAEPMSGGVETAKAPVADGGGIATIDMTLIYQSHARFQQNMDQLRREVQKAEADLKTLGDSIQLLQGAARATAQEQLATRLRTQKQEFLREEAIHYADAYDDIVREVERHSNANGIRLVLQFNGAKLGRDDPQAVQATLNQMIVFQSDLDITDVILARLNAPR